MGNAVTLTATFGGKLSIARADGSEEQLLSTTIGAKSSHTFGIGDSHDAVFKIKTTASSASIKDANDNTIYNILGGYDWTEVTIVRGVYTIRI